MLDHLLELAIEATEFSKIVAVRNMDVEVIGKGREARIERISSCDQEPGVGQGHVNRAHEGEIEELLAHVEASRSGVFDHVGAVGRRNATQAFSVDHSHELGEKRKLRGVAPDGRKLVCKGICLSAATDVRM